MSKKVKTSPKPNKTQKEIENLREQLARVLADYDNLQKRITRQQREIEIRLKAQIVARFLPVFDMFKNIQEHLKDSGLAMALKELDNKFKEEGVELIDPNPGDKFDESLHEAVEAIEHKLSKGRVVKTSLTGYKINDYIIRPAKVVVSKGKEEK